ncbi:hypothetical protein DQ04_00151160 [Trypanosoma grayi]|uniref:hypothetical protein n=1 Tax=Trypanosoma grayi TaxID=71804 RepID=UPI0004F4271D|nr:hypothetical protein DQ04_00151160 [Trypanosoma grayi]KEG15197.1 hypothetical protein DQ04_00151160 [Trypanosoma grayi]
MDGRGNIAAMNEGSVRSHLSSRSGGVKVHVGPDAKSGGDRASNSLPAIPAAVQQRSARVSDAARNPLALLASESRATAMRTSAQERWRSALLEYEVALKELVTNNIDAPPSEGRLLKTFQLFDAVSRVAADQSPELADLLKMFRVEFCRATFARQSLNEIMPERNVNAEEDAAEEELGSTYFEQVDVLLRENAALRVEVNLGNTRNNMALLKQQIDRLQEMVGYYENEVGRLERENERSAESYRKTRDELDEQRLHHRRLLDKFDDDKQHLLQDNKEMQLRLLRLRKYLSDKESTVIKDAYMYLKDKKMSVMKRLFDEGDERVSILVMLSQLESRVNEALDDYDKDTLLCEESEQPEQQQRMLDVVSVLLEEMHLCEERYLRLVPHGHTPSGEEGDETDGFVSLLSDPRLYDALVARVAAREMRNAAATAAAASPEPEAETELDTDPGQTLLFTTVTDSKHSAIEYDCKRLSLQDPGDLDFADSVDSSIHQLRASQVAFSPTLVSEEASATVPRSAKGPPVQPREAPAEALQVVKKKQEEWVASIFGTAVETTELLTRVCTQSGASGNKTNQERLLQYFISKPMLDVSNNKFHSGIDIYTGPGPLTQAFLCSVMHVDPVAPLHVPQGTNFMHVKYRNPMRQEAVGEDLEQASSVLPSADALDEWGGKTTYVREEPESELPELVNNGFIFNELKQPSGKKGNAKSTTAASSSTPTSTTFERLNPLSPNRSPEWLLYQNLFGGYRPLTPRLIDISYIDHILLNACERHFERAEERYLRCLKQARGRATNTQMALNMTERFFKESYTLTDFQESIVRELESRYCYPELVAKALYEILCFLDAMMASQPLVDLYLSCIRGFESPTRIHYITHVLYQLSINWPSANPEEAVLKEDVHTLMEHIYKKASRVTSMSASEILTEYQMATRSAPITLTSLRNYLVTAMLHFEDPLLLYFNGLLSYRATSSSVVEMNYEQFESAIKDTWEEKIEGKALIRYLIASCGFNKKAELTTKELACVATSMWSSELWANM